jgi:L-asparaginase II
MAVPAEDIEHAVDGCGLPTFALPLDAVAQGCARFAAAAADGQPAPRRFFAAMTRHPDTSRNRPPVHRSDARGRCNALRQGRRRRFYCAGIPNQRLGIAIKVEMAPPAPPNPPFSPRCVASDAITDANLTTLARYARPSTLNTRGEIVGSIEARVTFY